MGMRPGWATCRFVLVHSCQRIRKHFCVTLSCPVTWASATGTSATIVLYL